MSSSEQALQPTDGADPHPKAFASEGKGANKQPDMGDKKAQAPQAVSRPPENVSLVEKIKGILSS